MLRSRLALQLALALVLAAPALAQAGLHAGPMLGYATHREAVVWVQTEAPATVALEYAPTGTAAALPPTTDREVPEAVAARGGRVEMTTTADGDHVAQFVLGGLEPGVTYGYSVTVDDADVATAYPLTFSTQPLWQWRADPPTFTAAIGSCSYVNDAPYDRPGSSYGGDYHIFDRIADRDPDLMLWLGDNVYLREVDWWSPGGIDYRYAHTRALPEMQRLLANQPNYATWDDHDFGPNDSDRSYILKGEALETFERYWANPSYGLPGVPGVFGHFQWADAEFFLLDNRYYRTPNALQDADDTVLGRAQLLWLLDALAASRAPFKFVAFGGQVLNPVAVYENYVTVAPEERAFLLDEIHRRRIEGVVFLSGDRHHGELDRMEREGAYPLYEFTSSPLTAGAASNPRDAENPIRVPGTLITGTRNFGTLTVEGERTDRVLTMRAFDDEGAELWAHTVRANDLRYPRDE